MSFSETEFEVIKAFKSLLRVFDDYEENESYGNYGIVSIIDLSEQIL